MKKICNVTVVFFGTQYSYWVFHIHRAVTEYLQLKLSDTLSFSCLALNCVKLFFFPSFPHTHRHTHTLLLFFIRFIFLLSHFFCRCKSFCLRLVRFLLHLFVHLLFSPFFCHCCCRCWVLDMFTAHFHCVWARVCVCAHTHTSTMHVYPYIYTYLKFLALDFFDRCSAWAGCICFVPGVYTTYVCRHNARTGWHMCTSTVYALALISSSFSR